VNDTTTRRRFIRALALGAGLSMAKASMPQWLRALPAKPPNLQRPPRQFLRAVILEHASVKTDPVLLMHGMRAMGKKFPVGRGTAFDYLCEHYLEQETLNGKTYLRMPLAHEGHTNAFLSEAILEAGFDLDHAFIRGGRRYIVGDLVRGAKARFTFQPDSLDPNDLAWTLTAFARTTDPQQDQWVNAYGSTVRFREVVEFTTTILQEASRPLQTARQHGESETAMKPAEGDIRNFACAGTHLIYGLVTCVAFGHGGGALREQVKGEIDLLVWRLQADSRLIDDFYSKAAGQYPRDLVRLHRLEAKLKFLGHSLEVLGASSLSRVFSATSSQREAIRAARKELLDVIAGIQQAGLAQFAVDQELHRSLVADGCHAYRALGMTVV
jgi:hypothetical protein